MHRILKIIFWIQIVFCFIFASWYVLHGDIVFTSDIARDFHLFGEIAQKKIVLIGPRSSTGLFHGPLWLYLNFPAYFIGKGNPVVVGWWWVILSFLSLIPGFLVAKKLFNTLAAYCYTLLLSLFYAFNARGLFNPHGAMFVMPIFFYFFVTYLQKEKVQYLIGMIITVGALIQFQMADGIPLAILSFTACTVKIIKTKQFAHFFSFFLLGICLGNFVLFDLRHQHILLGKVFDFLSPIQKGQQFNYLGLISNRLSLLFSSPEILRRNIGITNMLLFLITLVGMGILIKKKLFDTVYLSFIYIYFGFFLLSFLNKGQILYFYLFPLFPLIFLMFASLASKFKVVFGILFVLVLLANTASAYGDIQDSKAFIGQDIYSWKFLSSAANTLYSQKDTSFGYFVYSPDVVAYEGRYAMLYQARLHSHIEAKEFTKEDVTYLFVAPPPSNNPYMHDDWWRIHQLNIEQSPQLIKDFSNGYKVQKVVLTQDAIHIPFDPNLNPGISFR